MSFFLSRITEKLHSGTLGCFTKNLLSKKFLDKMGKKKDYQDFWSKTICPTVQKNFVGEIFSGSLNKGIEKDLPMRVNSGFSLRILLFHSTRKLCTGTLLCSTKFLLSENFWDVRGGAGWEGVSRLPVKIVLSHSNESFRRRTILCFTKILVSETLMVKMGGGAKEYHDFLSKIFVPQRRKLS